MKYISLIFNVEILLLKYRQSIIFMYFMSISLLDAEEVLYFK